ncbi:hypothetical protein [Tengunoibacter tsumagoiensis]|uniref:hypothetical protein n=1 Tax=Tengunoibacter tsumagoiensis TaxID=2014871 RepID=UPI0010A95861|nr:hypothetical protein [Tengunoibacter tsumagoiensis]
MKPEKTSKFRFWPWVWETCCAAWQGFVESIYITHMWSWFMNLVTRLVQPVLFVTVMYSIGETYPNFPKINIHGASLSLIMFLSQNAALDLGSFGLPGLARAAQAKGLISEDSATAAIALSKNLFYVMMANLVWGAVQRVIPGMPDSVILIISLIFIVIRSYFALEYSKVVHALQPHDDHKKEPRKSRVQEVHDELLEILDQRMDQRQSSLDRELSKSRDAVHEAVTGLEAKVREVQESIVNLDRELAEVHGSIASLNHGLVEIQAFKVQVHEAIEGFNGEIQAIHGEIGEQIGISLLERVEPLMRTIEDCNRTAFDQLGDRIATLREELSSKIGAIHGELQVQVQEVREVQTKITEVHTEVHSVQMIAGPANRGLPRVDRESSTDEVQVHQVQGIEEEVHAFFDTWMVDHAGEYPPNSIITENFGIRSKTTLAKYKDRHRKSKVQPMLVQA